MLEATCVFAKTSNLKIKCSIKNYAGNRCSAIFPNQYLVHLLESI